MKIVVVIVLVVCSSVSYAQEKLEFGDTGTTTEVPKYKSNKKDYKSKKPIEWVKNSPQGLLLGNPCMNEVSKDMGFTYVIQNPKRGRYDIGRMNGFNRFWHNLAAKLRITLKNGPFWKFKLKKKRKECRKLTGDFVG